MFYHQWCFTAYLMGFFKHNYVLLCINLRAMLMMMTNTKSVTLLPPPGNNTLYISFNNIIKKITNV